MNEFGKVTILTQYSIVCQVPGAEPFTVGPYSGTDLSQVLGINQTSMPEGYYGWIQEYGEAVVGVSGQAIPAFADFRPNTAKLELIKESSKASDKHHKEPSLVAMNNNFSDHKKVERLSLLTPLLIEYGPYCKLIREARDVFIDGHFYACVAMCGISFERFQRDKAAPYGVTRDHKMRAVRGILQGKHILTSESIAICKNMADLRNDYAHGQGLKPEEDAIKAIQWMHSFIDKETNLMRDYIIVDGVLSRKGATKEN